MIAILFLLGLVLAAYRELLRQTLGDREAAERLIALERETQPDTDHPCCGPFFF